MVYFWIAAAGVYILAGHLIILNADTWKHESVVSRAMSILFWLPIVVVSLAGVFVIGLSYWFYHHAFPAIMRFFYKNPRK